MQNSNVRPEGRPTWQVLVGGIVLRLLLLLLLLLLRRRVEAHIAVGSRGGRLAQVHLLLQRARVLPLLLLLRRVDP